MKITERIDAKSIAYIAPEIESTAVNSEKGFCESTLGVHEGFEFNDFE